MITYTIKEVAEMFKLDDKMIIDLLDEGKLGYIRICDKIRITENQLKRFIEKKENEYKDFDNVEELAEEENLMDLFDF